MIHGGLRTDTVSRDEEEPTLGTAGTPKPGLPMLWRLHRAMSIGQHAAGQLPRARGKGDRQQRVFITLVAEGFSGALLWSIPEDLLVPPNPMSRPVLTEGAEGMAGSPGNRKALQGWLCTPLLTPPATLADYRSSPLTSPVRMS